jgi:DNA-binding NarL/FixJ family response regulator
MIDVLIVDDQALIRDGLRAIFEDRSDLRVVGEAEDGAQGVRLSARLSPGVVLMDLRMPGMDGVAATSRIVQQQSPPYVLVLTTYDSDENVLAALQAGASGFLLKDAPRDRIIEAVQRVVRGEAQLAPQVTQRLVDRIRASPRALPVPRLPTLTRRELDVLKAVARGRTNAEIADQLHLSITTVKSYASSLFAKLGVNDRVQATVLAYESGLITPRLPDR